MCANVYYTNIITRLNTTNLTSSLNNNTTSFLPKLVNRDKCYASYNIIEARRIYKYIAI